MSSSQVLSHFNDNNRIFGKTPKLAERTSLTYEGIKVEQLFLQHMGANNKSIEEIREYFGVDSLGYLSIDGMLDVLPEEKRNDYCCACFNGSYPIEVEDPEVSPQNKC